MTDIFFWALALAPPSATPGAVVQSIGEHWKFLIGRSPKAPGAIGLDLASTPPVTPSNRSTARQDKVVSNPSAAAPSTGDQPAASSLGMKSRVDSGTRLHFTACLCHHPGHQGQFDRPRPIFHGGFGINRRHSEICPAAVSLRKLIRFPGTAAMVSVSPAQDTERARRWTNVSPSTLARSTTLPTDK